ncbi:MAG: RNA polymerase factor sigma-54 [Kiloniellales bacterium]|nr:RNA polymerase factor sigma-54 [Kiloniellales bacterium]
MAVTQRLELRQSQTLVMTPQLQQAIKLLQLSNMELRDYVDQELESNPLLERDESGEAGTPIEDGGPGEGAADASAEREPEPGDAGQPDTLDLATADTLPGEAEPPLDTSFENEDTSWSDGGWQSQETGYANAQSGGGGTDAGQAGIEQQANETPNLRQHLLYQIQIELSDPVEQAIGIQLIDLLDEAGYVMGDLAEVADTLGCDTALVESTLRRMQRFDPTGIFARSLRECLAIQLAERNRLDPAIETLLDHLPLVAEGDAARLQKLCAVDDEDLADMVAEIRALDPKPAAAFESGPIQPVVPDILMRAKPGGGWLIELNSETLPRVLVNGSYYAQISDRARSASEREFITQRFQSASWLVKSLHQRATTILKVASEIVRQQDAFFHKGVTHLRPLTLRDVAAEIEMHESTVSRVTSNKFIATPRGTFELKYFFSASITATETGAAHAAESVRHRIKQLIEAEDPKKPMSDEALVSQLRKDGIEIARRTVAKYREALRIPSSSQRRRLKCRRL